MRYFPGDFCNAEGQMECRLTDEMVSEFCDAAVCQTCVGLEAPYETADCRCECNGLNVLCKPKS